MGCKQHQACANNAAMNFVKSAEKWNRDDQCLPGSEKRPSTCVQCCDKTANCGLEIQEISVRNQWTPVETDHVLPVNTGPSSRQGMFREGDDVSADQWIDPNDSRYTGDKTDFVRNENDSRHEKDDERHEDDDYSGGPPSSRGWNKK